MTCRAVQYSDQMQCPCGLAWDVNDPEPPQCPAVNAKPVIVKTQPGLHSREVARQEINKIMEMLEDGDTPIKI